MFKKKDGSTTSKPKKKSTWKFKEQEAVVKKYATQLPKFSHELYVKACIGKCSPRQKIKAMCQHCVNYEDTRKSIKYCTSFKCPLWRERPYQEVEDSEVEKDEA
jgi:hypothetical protein